MSWGTGLTAETALLPDNHRYKLNINVNNQNLTTTPLSLPQIVLQRATLAFKGATSADQSGLDSWKNDGSTTSSAPCSINVLPSIKVEGTETASGTGPVSLCKTDNVLAISLTLPELSSPIIKSANFSHISAADYHALQAYAFQASDRLLTERVAKLTSSVRAITNPQSNLEETQGEFLHIAALKYMRYISDAAKRIGGINDTSGENGNHIGLTSTQSKVQYMFDLPFSIYRQGFLIDMPGVEFRAVDLTTGALNYKSFMIAGHSSSNYESYIWHEMARLDAVSTVRGLQYARETGIEVIRNLTKANWATESIKFTSNADASKNYSAEFVNSIKTNYIDQNFTVTIPRSEIQYANWKGAVFLAERDSSSTGEGYRSAYIINGAYSGGYAVGFPLGITSYTPAIGNGFNLIPELYTPITNNSTSLINNTTGSNGWNNFMTVAGDPVNMVTGNMYHTERDIFLKGRGGLPIVFERNYNSRQPQDGPLGFGWTHSFNHYLRFYGVEGTSPALAKVSWVDGNGGEKFFATTAHSSGNINVNTTFPRPAGIFVDFSRRADGTYTIREKNGLTYIFAPVNGTATNSGIKAKLLSIRDRNGNTLTMDYTAITGCTGGVLLCKVTDGLGRSLTFTYSGTRISAIVDWDSRRFEYGYDTANGNLTSFKNPLAVAGSQGAVLYAYYGASDGVNLNHALKSYTLPNGNAMVFEYYMNGKVFRHITQPLKQTNTFTYNDFRRESVQVNERGHTRRFFFDENGNPIKIIAENGAVNQYTYDPANPFNRISETDPQGNKTQYAYDANGNITQITTPRGATATLNNFTAFNQPQRVKDARNNYTVLKYDAQGNLTEEIKLKAGITPSIPYTPVTTQVISWRKQTSDSYGNLTSIKRLSDFDIGLEMTVNFNYDSTRLNMTSISRQGDKNGDGTIDAADVSPTLIYNARGLPTTDIDADWHVVTKNYDSVDRITKMTDAVGQLRDYKYDANGNPVDQSLTSNGGLIDRQSARYDSSDRKITSVDTGGNVTQYGYDAIGNVTSITNPDNYRVSIAYDEANRVSKAYDAEGRSVTTTRDVDGKPRSVTDPNGNTTTYEYWDNTRDGRLKRTTQPAIQSFAQGRAVEYDYDANGNIIKASDYPADGSAARITLTTYDELNRPVRIVGPAYNDATLGVAYLGMIVLLTKLKS